jgi:hypothetical protein
MPGGSAADAARRWLAAYIDYARAAVAGPVAVSFTSDAAALASSVPPGSFFAGLDSAASRLWTGAVWAGPGFTGASAPTTPLSELIAAASRAVAGSHDPDFALGRFTDALHSYTLAVSVVVTSAAGATSLATPA